MNNSLLTYHIPHQPLNKMPNKHKSRNNTSRKSTASSQTKVSVKSDETDDDWSSGLIKVKSAPSSKKTTPTSPRPEFLEPLSPTPVSSQPPPTPWEELGMTEEAFLAMQERVRKQMIDTMRENYVNNMLAEFESPSYWERRIERLEKEREFFNKKRGWSAADIACVDQIDKEIEECERELDRIFANVDRLEYEYD